MNHTFPGKQVASTTRPLTRSRLREVLVGVALVAVTVLTSAPSTASAVSGVHVVVGTSGESFDRQETINVPCPRGERVIGGGGMVWEDFQGMFPEDRQRVALSELRPYHPSRGRDLYIVTGVWTTPIGVAPWRLFGYAMCARPIDGLRIRERSPATMSSDSKQAIAVRCPTGRRVLGTGARISVPPGGFLGRMVIQVARPSRPGDIARAQAHEVPGGYGGQWGVTAYAVCAPKPAGYKVVFEQSPLRDSEYRKLAGNRPNDGCPAREQVLSPGAAVGSDVPGNIALAGIAPFEVDHHRTFGMAVENTPTGVDWDFIVATAVCASP